MTPCPEVTFAVVYPVAPRTIRLASMTATVFPARFKSVAAVSPVIPAPMTAASTDMSASRAG